MAKFWGRLFLINFALGVVTGITMEFQFGMNWAEYSKYRRATSSARRWPSRPRPPSSWSRRSSGCGPSAGRRSRRRPTPGRSAVVAFAANLSALWILLANGWMQKPVGFVLRNGRAEMTDFAALVFNGYGWLDLRPHRPLGLRPAPRSSSWASRPIISCGKSETDFFRTSFRTAAVFGLAAALLVVVTGDMRGVDVAKHPAGQARGHGVALGDADRRPLHAPRLAGRRRTTGTPSRSSGSPRA